MGDSIDLPNISWPTVTGPHRLILLLVKVIHKVDNVGVFVFFKFEKMFDAFMRD